MPVVRVDVNEVLHLTILESDQSLLKFLVANSSLRPIVAVCDWAAWAAWEDVKIEGRDVAGGAGLASSWQQELLIA